MNISCRKTACEQLQRLKELSGSHLPSINSLISNIEGLEIKIDACFLSNPYATDLFLEYFLKAFEDKRLLRNLVEYYPTQNRQIAESLATYLKVPPEKIFVGNGATEIIQAILHRFTKHKVLINTPTFSPYYEFVRPDTEVIFHPLKKEEHFKVNKEDYLATLRLHSPDTAILINPNNPDGGHISQKELRELLEEMRGVEQVVLDESFLHFCYESPSHQFINNNALHKEFPNLIILKSMSKDFGVAGLRAGYAIMSEVKVAHLLQNGYLWNISGFAEYFFRLLTQQSFQEQYEVVRVKFIKETQLFYERLKKNPAIKVYQSKTNFFLVEFPLSIDANEVAIELLFDYGIYVRSCQDKLGLGKQFIRIASRTHSENIVIAEAIEKITQRRMVAQ